MDFNDLGIISIVKTFTQIYYSKQLGEDVAKKPYMKILINTFSNIKLPITCIEAILETRKM